MHFSKEGRHPAAGFWWKVEVKGWVVPCCCVDDLFHEFDSIRECRRQVMRELIIGRKVKIL